MHDSSTYYDNGLFSSRRQTKGELPVVQLTLDPTTVQQHSFLYCVPNRTYPLEWETDIVGHTLFHFPLRTYQGWPPLPKLWPSDWASPNKHLCQRHRTDTVGGPILLLFRRERAGVLTLQTDWVMRKLWERSLVWVGYSLKGPAKPLQDGRSGRSVASKP